MLKNNLNITDSDETIKKKTVIGSVFSVGAQLLKTVVQFVTTAFLARLLSPEDFGLVALTLVVTGFILIFKDLGLSMASVQKDEISHEQVSNLFWVNFIFSILFAFITVLISPLIAEFFNDDRLILITAFSGLSLILGGLSVQHQALLRRTLQFKNLAIADLVSRVLASIIVVIWALKTNSYWSLVFLPILTSFFYAVFMWIMADWKPSFIKRGVGTKSMLHFGKNMTHYGIVNYFARNADNLIIGKISGATELGYYSRAYSLMLLPIGQLIAPLTGVIVPALSRMQNKPEDFSIFYKKIIELLAYFIFPIIATMFLLSDEIIDIFLGPQWEESKTIFKILCLAAFWQPILSTTGWILTSLGQTKRIVKWGYINSTLLIIVFFIGSFWGALGVSYCYALYMWLVFIPNLIFSLKFSSVNYLDVLKTLKNPFIINLIYVFISYFTLNILDISSIYLKMGTQLLVTLIFWSLVFMLNKNIRMDILKFKQLIIK